METRETALRVVGGVAAGLAATWLMGRATTYMYEHESKVARQREDRARGGETAFAIAARKIASGLGTDLSPSQSARYGRAIHWAIGATSGLAYALFRGRSSRWSATSGLTFGAGLFVVMDEAVNYLFGLTPGPTAFPWQAHARGLAGHLVFGATTQAALGAIETLAA